MTTATLDKVLEEVKGLTPGEQLRVRAYLDAALELSPETILDLRVQQALMEKGLLSEIKFPRKSVSLDQEYELVKVKGKPVSETIIEERR